MRTKYKPWAKPFIEEHQEIQIAISSLNELKSLYLEIGSGKGQFLVEMAKKFPERYFVGIERNVTCAGFTAKKLVESELNNAKIIWHDAQKVLTDMDENKVNVLYLNFSDPWPKVRHHKRRLTSSIFCDLYKKVLKPDGVIIQKTDNEELFNFSIATFKANGFDVFEIDNNYQLEEDDVLTEYEESFRKENLPIYRLKARLC